MTEHEIMLSHKIQELILEMKITSLWQKETPNWVNNFEKIIFNDGKDFAQWLQFVFIPNHTNNISPKSFVKEKTLIVLPAIKFFGADVHKGKLLQILIEIDSLI